MTNFMLIIKHPHKKVEYDFRSSINSVLLKGIENVKYLRVHPRDKLKWSDHVKYLSL